MLVAWAKLMKGARMQGYLLVTMVVAGRVCILLGKRRAERSRKEWLCHVVLPFMVSCRHAFAGCDPWFDTAAQGWTMQITVTAMPACAAFP